MLEALTLIDVGHTLPADFAAAVVRGCDEASGAGRCWSSAAGAPPEPPSYVVNVESDESNNQITLRLRRADSTAELEHTTLEFPSASTLEARGVSTGLVAATLVFVQSQKDAASAAPEPRESAPPVSPSATAQPGVASAAAPEAHSSRAAGPSTSVAVGLWYLPPWRNAASGLGGLLRGSTSLGQSYGGVTGSLRRAIGGTAPAYRWSTLSLGWEYPVSLGESWVVTPRLEGMVRYLQASISDPQTGEQDSGTYWRGGVEAGSAIGLHVTEALTLEAALGVSALLPRVQVYVLEREVAVDKVFAPSAELLLRVGFL